MGLPTSRSLISNESTMNQIERISESINVKHSTPRIKWASVTWVFLPIVVWVNMTCTLHVLANIAPKAKEKDNEIITAFIWNMNRKTLSLAEQEQDVFRFSTHKHIQKLEKPTHHAHVFQLIFWYEKSIHSKDHNCYVGENAPHSNYIV